MEGALRVVLGMARSAGWLVTVGVVQVGGQGQAGAEAGAQEGTAHGHLRSEGKKFNCMILQSK